MKLFLMFMQRFAEMSMHALVRLVHFSAFGVFLNVLKPLQLDAVVIIAFH